MAFVQIMEVETDEPDALLAMSEEWFEATEGRHTVRREIVARDRSAPDRYVVIVFFDSYESAMENSALPETQADAEKYGSLTRSITFRDLDVVFDVTP